MATTLSSQVTKTNEIYDYINKTGSVILHTGNIISPACMANKRRSSCPAEEISGALYCAFQYYINSSIKREPGKNEMNRDSISLDWCPCNNLFKSEERPYLKITQKVFLYNLNGALIRDAVHNLIAYLKTDKIDNLIICLPDALINSMTAENGKIPLLVELWKYVETLIDEKSVGDAGLTDMPLDILQELYRNCERHKPSLLQVDIAICCQVPPELKLFSNETHTRLLVSREPNEMFSHSELNVLINKHSMADNEGNDLWKMEWLMRYTVLCDRHSVIRNKGYAIKAIKSSHE
ncbi:hypothetical protein ACOME3_010313 [Neoechinorhynchus agilis]